MSVFVKGMELPETCCDCPLFKSNTSGQMFCRAKGVAFGREDAEWLPKTRPNWCPLVSVPPHGRLIDADALIESNKYLRYDPSEHEEDSYDAGWAVGFNAGASHATEHAVYAKTIIEAEAEND